MSKKVRMAVMERRYPQHHNRKTYLNVYAIWLRQKGGEESWEGTSEAELSLEEFAALSKNGSLKGVMV